MVTTVVNFMIDTTTILLFSSNPLFYYVISHTPSRVGDITNSGNCARFCALTEWCQQNQVKVPTLRYWVNKLNKESSLTSVGTEWLSVKIPVSNSKCFNGEIPCGIKVTIGQASIEVSPGFDHQVLGDVVRILLEQC